MLLYQHDSSSYGLQGSIEVRILHCRLRLDVAKGGPICDFFIKSLSEKYHLPQVGWYV